MTSRNPVATSPQQARLGARSGHAAAPAPGVKQHGRHRERERVEGERPAAADPDHQQAGRCRVPMIIATFWAIRRQEIALLEQCRRARSAG